MLQSHDGAEKEKHFYIITNMKRSVLTALSLFLFSTIQMSTKEPHLLTGFEINSPPFVWAYK